MKNSILTSGIFLFTALFSISCNGDKSSTREEIEDKTATEVPIQEEVDYLKKGKGIAMQTKGSLGKYLIAALSTLGPEGALGFCNTKAIPITDSMAKELSASIKRVSDKPRNPSNQAKESELAYIKQCKEWKVKGEILKPKLMDIDGKMVGYYPIITNQMCMQCHGSKEKDINATTLANINKLYPKDKATGYKTNEIRGLFVVGMNKK